MSTKLAVRPVTVEVSGHMRPVLPAGVVWWRGSRPGHWILPEAIRGFTKDGSIREPCRGVLVPIRARRGSHASLHAAFAGCRKRDAMVIRPISLHQTHHNTGCFHAAGYCAIFWVQAVVFSGTAGVCLQPVLYASGGMLHAHNSVA